MSEVAGRIALIEGERVMAIPHELEETTLPTSHQHLMATEEEMEVAMATGEDKVISVRMKGRGKEIKINMDAMLAENTGCPVFPATSAPTAAQKYIERQSEKPPHVRSTKKRQLSPRLKEVGVSPERVASLLAETKDSDFQEGLKDNTKAPVIPLKKRRLPDSPLKKYQDRKEKLKQRGQYPVISQDAAIRLLQKWRREGVEINGRWFDLHLTPRTTNASAYSTFLKQHDFSPGKEIYNDGGLENEPDENKKDGQVDVKELENEEDSLPTIAEEQTLPVFVGQSSDSPEPENMQDWPVDLTCKNDMPLDLSCKTLEQEKPVDYSILANFAKDVANNEPIVDSAVFGIISATEQALDQHEAGFEAEQPTATDNSLQFTASENSCDSLQLRDADTSCDSLQFTSADTKCESLPSLTLKTENLNLHSENLGQSAALPPAAPTQVITLDLNKLLQLLVDKARPVSARPVQIPAANQRAAADAGCVSPKPATSAGSPVQQSAVTMDQRDQDAPVPNMLFNLGMTQDDGTLCQTKNDMVKDKLKKRLQR